MAWDPVQYRKFSSQRLRPAIELLNRLWLDNPTHVVDLGCGEGQVTKLLRERWPRSAITGIDSSADMLAVAAREEPSVEWLRANINSWSAQQPVELVFSNAALHWLDDHASLFPRLARSVEPGGILAVSMPCNFDAPSHTVAADIASSGPWREKLVPVVRQHPVGDPAFYCELLAPLAQQLDIWETEYLQLLEGENPVAEWTKGSMLRPLLTALDDEERDAFEVEYRRRIAAAYPRGTDGVTLFPFRRLFIVARTKN
ncbi:MAG: methyltransferase domain-containing protein [Acidiferrobacterales bacterium]